ncbi:MAG: serpin family protein [Bacteroidales bacterium]|nr:serpin family protein [Bacteroidales bacterium]MCF8334120.1 serpin family protein [Bacteroidales bacterium]
MNYLKYIGLFLLILLFTNCSKDNTETEEFLLNDSEKATRISKENNAFGLRLFQKLNHQKNNNRNIVISPLSTAMVLGMAYNGTENETKEKLSGVLGWNQLDRKEINHFNNRLINHLHDQSENIQMNIANAIWYSRNIDIKPAFLKKNKDNFHAFASSVNAENQPTSEMINRWATRSTDGNITNVVERIPSRQMLYLLNATYFKGNWKNDFNKSKTTESTFFLENGTSKSISMMWQKADLKYYDNNQFQLVELPYENKNYCMYILLPDSDVKLERVIDSLNYKSWHSYKESLSMKRNINFGMPRFQCEHSVGMKDLVSGMGLEKLFHQSKADLSGISDQQVAISEMMHKAAIDVDEEGTEASAATSLAISFTTLVEDNPFNLIVNRPFIFAIEEKRSNTLLFIGKMTRP